jgi:hypothetical protein
LRPEAQWNLPRKFEHIDDDEMLVVQSTGAITVEKMEMYYFHSSQFTHYSGHGGYVDDRWYDADPTAEPKFQGKGRRWAYLPWTTEQEHSCRPFMLSWKKGQSVARSDNAGGYAD